ncbi:unnamed protein product [Rotaria sp. Silwood1]|nr:unnamed protein product [Rotaria sp. Silwood1]
MTQKVVTIYATDANGTNRKNHVIKTYSFNTDDDDTILMTKSLTVPNHRLVSVNSPSIDSANVDDDSSEASNKPKTKRSRQIHESEKKIENKRSQLKTYPWYKKINWSKPLLVVGSLILLYLMWTKQDIWIPRLLTSNIRIQRSVVVQDREISNELTNSSLHSSPTNATKPSKDSRLKTVRTEDTIENSDEKNDDQGNSERINVRSNDNSTGSSTKSSSGHRVHIRARRTKMSFSKEHEKKKYRSSRNLPIDDDLDDAIDDDLDDTIDDDLNGTIDTEENKPIKSSESISPSHRRSRKKHRRSQKKHHHREVVRYENSKPIAPLKRSIRLSTYNDIIDQLRRNLKSRNQGRKFLSTVSKTTGLSKKKLYRFIYKKDFRLLTIQTFISILDTFNLMLLIVPKQV